MKHKPVLLNISTICSGHAKKGIAKFALKKKRKKNIKFIQGLLLNNENIMHSQGVYESEKYSEILDSAFSVCFSYASLCTSS